MRALLIDDHALFRDTLGLLIGQRFPQLQLMQAGDLASALALLAEHADTALVLLDLSLPDSHGTSAIAQLHEQSPRVRVLVLSADDRRETVEQAIEQGACGFVPKTSRGDVLVEAIALTLDGGVYLPPACLVTAAAPADRAAPGCDLASLGLTRRQIDVLRLLIDGKSNKLIGRELALSESTIKTHLAAIFRRLDVGSRTQAVLEAARLGLRLPAV